MVPEKKNPARESQRAAPKKSASASKATPAFSPRPAVNPGYARDLVRVRKAREAHKARVARLLRQAAESAAKLEHNDEDGNVLTAETIEQHLLRSLAELVGTPMVASE